MAPIEAKPVALPGDFEMELTLLTSIDSAKAAVGDTVQARVEKPLREGRRQIVPKGAVVTGRILKLQREGRTYRVDLSFHSLDFEGYHADLKARHNKVAMVVVDRSMSSQSLRGGQSGMGETSKSKQPIMVETDHLRLYKGFLLYLHSRLVKSE